MKLAAIVLVTIASMSAAVADGDEPPSTDPDDEATRAGDANLESLAKRRGFLFGASLGPSVTISKSLGTGTGGTLALRLGQVATPRTVIAFELNAGAQVRRVGIGLDAMGKAITELRTNSVASFLAGAQFWFGPSIWIRINGGFGVTTCQKCSSDGTTDTRRAGLAGGGGLGVDIVRFKGLVLGVETYNVSQITKDGWQVSFISALSLTLD